MKQLKYSRKYKGLLAFILSAAMALSMMPQMAVYVEADNHAGFMVANPRIEPAADMKAGQSVTWDCVYFGSYPQSWVTDEAVCAELEALTDDEWNQSTVKWDVTLDGTKYRKLRKCDITYSYGYQTAYHYEYSTKEYFYWDYTNNLDARYFKYEPIKWRVLKVEGNQALLLSDQILDCRRYHQSSSGDVTWENSTIRSWLNGYGKESNLECISYDHRTYRNFLDSAFTPEEQAAIVTTHAVTEDNRGYGTDGGEATDDKVVLLSEQDVSLTTAAAVYGFLEDGLHYDEARWCQSTAFAHAMGLKYNKDTESEYDKCSYGNNSWWLRTPGYNSGRVVPIDEVGRYDITYDCDYPGCYGIGVTNCFRGVRMAITLDLSATELYEYAGTVSSRDSKYEGEKTPEETAEPENTSGPSSESPVTTQAPAASLPPVMTQTPATTQPPVTTKTPEVSDKPVSSEKPVIPGDLDGIDGVTLRDAQMALKIALKIEVNITPQQIKAGDVMDHDGIVTLKDAQAILKRSLKIQIVFDVEK